MDDRRVGLVIRALRRRRGWRQLDLGSRAGIVQSVVSEIERGHIDGTSLRTLRRLVGALDGDLRIEVRWRGGESDRLLDEDHARLVAATASRIVRAGWEVRTEITYSEFGERGSYDVLGWHGATQTVVVIEVKTVVVSGEATLRKLDEKSRLVRKVVEERFAWRPRVVGRILVLAESTVNRRRLDFHSGLFRPSLPHRPAEVREWLAKPDGPLSGVLLLPVNGSTADKRVAGGPHRIRNPTTAA